MSLPTVRRRWRDGELPGAYRNPKGHIRVPHAALDAVRNKRHTPTGLSQRYVADALWVLRRVLGFARANGLAPAGFDPTESLDAPTPDPAAARTRRPTRQPRPLTLPECARIAAHLQPVHQIVFWLQRIMGLRISEAFGVLLGDVIELGDTAPARRPRPRRAHLQRPRRPRHRRRRPLQADDEDRGRLPHARRARQDAGTDPPQHRRLPRRPRSPAQVDPSDRLVPGIHEANRSGQQGYVHAFEDATIAEGLATADLGFRVSSHLLRKSLATDLAWQEGIEDTVRRRFMGHRAGDDVFGRIYTLDHPEIAPLVKVAAILDDKITASIGTLLTPTTRQPSLGQAQSARGSRRAHHRHLDQRRMAGRSRQPRRPPLRRRAGRRRTRHPPQHRPAVDGRRHRAGHRRPRRPRRPPPLQPAQRGVGAAGPAGPAHPAARPGRATRRPLPRGLQHRPPPRARHGAASRHRVCTRSPPRPRTRCGPSSNGSGPSIAGP